jgi:hypothetical protein
MFNGGYTDWEGHTVHMGEMINVYNVLVGNPERQRPLIRYRRRWKDNINMYLNPLKHEIYLT